MMNRVEVILALQKHARGEGPEIEWVCSTGVLKCRWHPEHGPQYLGCIGTWVNDAMHGQYREVFAPRTFLGNYLEVATFAEADSAGYRDLNGSKAHLKYRSDGKQIDYSLDDSDYTGPGRRWFWVKRIEAPVQPMRAVPVEELQCAVDSVSREDIEWKNRIINGVIRLIKKYESGAK